MSFGGNFRMLPSTATMTRNEDENAGSIGSTDANSSASNDRSTRTTAGFGIFPSSLLPSSAATDPSTSQQRASTSLTTSMTAGTSGSIADEGHLEAAILSAYDLPTSRQPIAVTMNIGNVTVSTGPPVAKHKDRNSFRFSTGNVSSPASATASSSMRTSSTESANDANTKSHILRIVKPFPQLYRSTATIRLVYDDPDLNLETKLSLNDLCIGQTSWQILNFIQSPSSSSSPTPLAAAAATTTTITGRTPNAAGTSATTHTATASAATRYSAPSVGDDVGDNPPPTIRIKVHLDAPYRPEIAALIAIAQWWFHLVDRTEDWIRDAASKIRVPTSSNMILLPLIPLITAIVVASPIMMGTLLVFMPVALPFFIIAITSIVASGLVMYSSTRHGREHIGGTVFIPFADSLLLSSKAGQRLIYQTGPRPTPVSLVRHILPTDPNSLWVSLAIDFVGSSSYLLPVVGELFDVIWAPIQFILVMAMYDSVHSNLKYVSLVEELMPFTDIVPTATIGWIMEHYGVHS